MIATCRTTVDKIKPKLAR